MPRFNRKDEHILIGLKQKRGLADFSDIHFIHNCLPERDLNEVNLKTRLHGVDLGSPFFINALTGGTPLAGRINAALALAARECNLPMALGSQAIALENPAAVNSFRIVRKINPKGILWANLGSYATLEMARRAVEMIDAAALQIHLNVPQELAMKEGDRCFRGALERIGRIAGALSKPVVVKEVGFGIAREQALLLLEAGVAAIDVGGRGGTNFLTLENRRSRRILSREILSWGIPTAISLIEVLDAVKGEAGVIAGGGMCSGYNIARALALGADAVGLAGYPLQLVLRKGPRALIRAIGKLEEELRLLMLMTGSSSLPELRRVPLVITGFTREWMESRQIKLPESR